MLPKNKLTRIFASLTLFLLLATVCFYIWVNIKQKAEYNKVSSRNKKSNAKIDLNVVLIISDGLRADHLGCYGYSRNTSPNIDKFTKEAVLFKNCYTTASWTKPAIASMLTSLYPSIHGVTTLAGGLSVAIPTIADILRDNGYITYGYISNDFLKSDFGFNRGFDFFDDLALASNSFFRRVKDSLWRYLPAYIYIKARNIGNDKFQTSVSANKRILSWLKRYKNNNFFMFLHCIDTHMPFLPSPPYNKMFPYDKGDKTSEFISQYDGEIRFFDGNIRYLLDALKSLGIYDKTMIIITADHGEGFGEHNNYSHGCAIYQELIKIPLIIKYPRMNNRIITEAIEEPVISIDIMPTILDFLHINHKEMHLDGVSLLPLFNEKGIKYLHRSILIDNPAIMCADRESIMVRGLIKNNTWKYILRRKPEEELYNLKNDPGELNNLASKEPRVLEEMRRELDLYIKGFNKRVTYGASEKKLDYETIQRLESLGYEE